VLNEDLPRSSTPPGDATTRGRTSTLAVSTRTSATSGANGTSVLPAGYNGSKHPDRHPGQTPGYPNGERATGRVHTPGLGNTGGATADLSAPGITTQDAKEDGPTPNTGIPQRPPSLRPHTQSALFRATK